MHRGGSGYPASVARNDYTHDTGKINFLHSHLFICHEVGIRELCSATLWHKNRSCGLLLSAIIGRSEGLNIQQIDTRLGTFTELLYT